MHAAERSPHIDLLAYLITFRCYGTWLHGDPRGSVDHKHNTPGTPLLPSMPGRVAREAALLRFPPVTLDAAQRRVVEESLRATCQHKDWDLHAVNARSNHVHAVVTADGWAPEEVMRTFKAWATRRLREARLSPQARPIWSHHGSTVYLWTPAQMGSAIWYVIEGQEHSDEE